MDWSFQMRVYLSLLDQSIGPGLATAETESRDMIMDSLTEQAQANARKIFFVLTMTVCGPPLGILKSTAQQNGYQAWHTLCGRYEGSSAGRQHNLLSKVLRPNTFS